MKAWTVKDRENQCALVFAPDRNSARHLGMGCLDACEYLDVSATRTPELDGREKNPPSMKELVQRCGWWLGCSACERMITDCDEKAVWSPKGGEVYCNKKCREYMKKARAANRRALERAAV